MKSDSLYGYMLLLILSLGLGTAALAVEGYENDAEYWEGYSPETRSVDFEANIGIHMMAQGFGSELKLFQNLTRYFQLGQSFQYFRDDQDAEEESGLHYGVDLNMRLAPFQEFMFAPFIAVGLGYNQWQEKGEQLNSPRVNYDLGMNIHLSKFFALTVVHRDISFVDASPETYWGQRVSDRNVSSNEIAMTFILNDKMF